MATYAYDPYEEEVLPERISAWATRDVYGNPLPIPDSYGIQDAPPYGFLEPRIKDAPPYGFRHPLPMPPDPKAVRLNSGEDYYTLSNPILSGDRFSVGSEGSVAFDSPSRGGVRYPIAIPETGGQAGSLGAVTPDWQRAIDEMLARDRPATQRQYNMEMDRVLRNQVEEANPSSVQDAVRLRGLLKFQQLTRDGMDSAAAIRMVAPELYFNHPQATAMATRDIPSLGMPSIQTIPVGDNEALFVDNKYRTTLRTPPKKDPISELESKEANEAVTQAMRELSNLQKSALPDDEKINAARKALDAARGLRRDVVRGIRTPAVPEAQDEMVQVISPSGQRGRVPRSKLDAAKKAGYKVQ